MNKYCCNSECPKGIKISEELLDKNNSPYDAALDFMAFIKECSKTCPYKTELKEED